MLMGKRPSGVLWTFVTVYYAIYLALIALVEPLGWFGGFRIQEVGLVGNILIATIPALIAGLIFLYRWMVTRRVQRFLGVVEVNIGDRRNDAFQDLRDRASKKIVVTGVGMISLVSYDLPSLRAQALTRDIEFLMLDPALLENNQNFAERVQEFFDIPDFASKVRASCDRLEEFCREWNQRPGSEHKMKLRAYSTIPTNSMTVIDPDLPTGEALVEFFLYQSGARRPRFRVKAVGMQGSMFDRIVAEYRRLWHNSREIV